MTKYLVFDYAFEVEGKYDGAVLLPLTKTVADELLPVLESLCFDTAKPVYIDRLVLHVDQLTGHYVDPDVFEERAQFEAVCEAATDSLVEVVSDHRGTECDVFVTRMDIPDKFHDLTFEEVLPQTEHQPTLMLVGGQVWAEQEDEYTEKGTIHTESIPVAGLIALLKQV